MAITKRFKVSFEMTVKVDSETEVMIQERILELARSVRDGEKVSAQDKELLVQALTYGADGAVAFAVKQGVRNEIREMGIEHHGEGIKFAPATIREVK
ncbi:Gp5.5-like host HNS inhibition [Yersinia phage PYPS50]|uniref:HNS binding protein n=1 Tax=Yersinia phage PYPS50 TaxID=2321391 RepID=A0A3G8F0I2_9CAUD|nr:Gp5.5-like host HNS inhibition [Yersinia phage PYPS50]AZF87556.1 HNS binding protein [Yersinia phage PYPS50]QQM13715.1 HNS binding protein [Yersinia phage PYps50T]QQO91371.1 HNS binding protein [Yersinia phage PYps49T]